MRPTIAELKSRSRGRLLGSYHVLIWTTILIILIAFLCTIPFSGMLVTGIQSANPGAIVIAGLGVFVVTLITVLFSSGLSWMHLKLARDGKTDFKDLFFPFRNHPDKFIGLAVVFILITFACQLPGTLLGMGSGVPVNQGLYTGTVFAGSLPAGIVNVAGTVILIILMLGFSMTFYVLLEDPYGVRVFQAMRISWGMMRGRKLRLFLLELSFIGWMILGAVSFGIGLLWVIQYYEQTVCQFYLELRWEAKERQGSAA